MKRQPATPYVGPTCLGIDVSRHNGSVSWGRVPKDETLIDGKSQGKVRFAFCRSGDGKDADGTCVQHLEEARAAGLLVGVYHYLRATHSGVMQADMALEALRVAGVRTAVVAVDIEGAPGSDTRRADGAWWTDSGQGVTTTRVLDCAAAFVAAVTAAGHRCVLYSGVAWHWYVAQEGLGNQPWLDGVELWTPYYTATGKVPKLPVDAQGRPAPWDSWRIWQYAGDPQRAQVPGIAGAVDLNRFRGDEAALARWWAPLERDTLPGFDRSKLLRLAEEAKRGGDLDAAAALVEASDRLRKG